MADSGERRRSVEAVLRVTAAAKLTSTEGSEMQWRARGRSAE